jgi:regulator of protease activity HflC (stomatin/prohibitin superfamily)
MSDKHGNQRRKQPPVDPLTAALAAEKRAKDELKAAQEAEKLAAALAAEAQKAALAAKKRVNNAQAAVQKAEKAVVERAREKVQPKRPGGPNGGRNKAHHPR